MKLILYLRSRYNNWLARRLLERLVQDGYYDTHVDIWSWMMDVLESKGVQEVSFEERMTIHYESYLTDIDALLVEMIDATRTMRENEAVTKKPPTELLTVRLEDYLVSYQNRPLPLSLIQEQFVKVCRQFLDALVHTKKKRAYYLRQYDWLIEEGQRWTEYWCFSYSTN